VVRAGIEALVREGADLNRLGAIISLGTPFFAYAVRRLRVRAIIEILAAAAMAALTIGAIRFFIEQGQFEAKPLWAWTLVAWAGFAGLCAIFLFLDAISLFRKPLRGSTSTLNRKISWTNLCSRTDEAIQLLRSFDRRIRLFGRPRKIEGGLIWAAIVFGMFVTVMTVSALWLRSTGWDSKVADGLAAIVSLLAVMVLYRIMRFTRNHLILGGSHLLDGLLTARLRQLAYGEDEPCGMTGVSMIPWADHPESHVALSGPIETEMEQWIARSTAGMWSRTRQAIRPDASFLEADFRHLIEQVLTGDELSHTVYYRIASLIDVVADLLVDTGDYVRVTPRNAVQSSRSL
jgi:hypothetical protein